MLSAEEFSKDLYVRRDAATSGQHNSSAGSSEARVICKHKHSTAAWLSDCEPCACRKVVQVYNRHTDFMISTRRVKALIYTDGVVDD